jgi:hypothetical protein
MNLNDHRNSEIRYAILNKDVQPHELVKMNSEELAPSSLKSGRIERQNKYFRENVLMKEEARIIAKTHKGESLLTVDNADDVDYYINNEEDKKDDVSEKASFDYKSDNEERNVEMIQPILKQSSAPINLSRNNSIKPRKEFKYRNLSLALKEFYYQLEELTPEKVINIIHDKLKVLKATTLTEINKFKEINNK